MPVITLKARGKTSDHIIGLQMGYDDYFAICATRTGGAYTQCLAQANGYGKCRAVTMPLRIARFADWALDIERRLLVNDSRSIVMLSDAEFRFLKAFVEQPNEVLTREALAQVGRVRDPTERSVDLQISRLRAKLGDDAKSPHIIRTVRNGGYLFASPVSYEQ